MRRATVQRKTKETDIAVRLALEGRGKTSVKTGLAFLDHMLTLLGTHGVFDLTLRCKGDLDVDLHHTNEDIGLALGQAFDQAMGSRKGIRRFGAAYVPMEEALARVVLDFSGRPRLVVRDARSAAVAKRPPASHGAYQWGDAEHFLESLARGARLTIHVDILSGSDFHHTCEAVFKALGRALGEASRLDPRVKGVPSSKGRL
ncbi:MAG: imidazoleglycerol-phosphate dehydratase [Candidatus Omnitrophica bacterium]|nr:imidazoleglycerol-phosphate dehydratase [Candidatus Omnitrophota bacterium]